MTDDRGTSLRDKTAIVGVGNTNYAALRVPDPARTSYRLGTEAFQAALDDAGLGKDNIDGFIVVRIPEYTRMAANLGLKEQKFVNILEGGGRMAGMAIEYAAMAVASGMANYIACIYGNDGRSAGATY